MPTVEKETVVTPGTSGSGPATALIVVLGIIVVAVIGYFIYSMSMNGNPTAPPTVIEHNTTIQPPSMPAPSAPSVPSTDK